MGRLRPHITVVGLGPAGAPYMSNGALALIANARHAVLRTARHPGADQLGFSESFDSIYEAAETFDEVYRGIVEELVVLATTHAPDPIVYAVPGSPLVAERTVELLRIDPRVDITIVPGLSFLDLAWDRLGIDPLTAGVHLVDAEQFIAQAGGQRGPFLVGQCWSQALLSDVKLSASTQRDGTLPDVVILHHLGLDDEQIIEVGWWELDRSIRPDHLTSLYIPALSATGSMEGEMTRLRNLMAILRERCPWDREQTHGSLMPHLIEETYEVLDAISEIQGFSGDDEGRTGAFVHLEEELGDLLFQIVFHACLAEEAGQFTLADVARGVHDKLVHRHPHVFADGDASTPEQVVANWEAIKKQEKDRRSVTEGIPSQLPALMFTTKLQRKALSVGVQPYKSWPVGHDLSDALSVLSQRAAEGGDPGSDGPLTGAKSEVEKLVGQLLFEVADLSRRLGVDAEQALRERALLLRDEILQSEGVHNPQVGTN